jgi:predicted DNA binding CopG/RHH family protein
MKEKSRRGERRVNVRINEQEIEEMKAVKRAGKFKSYSTFIQELINKYDPNRD